MSAKQSIALRTYSLQLWHLLVVLFAVAVLSVLYWASTSVESGLQKAKEGTVVDIATGHPITGASVVVRWYHYDVGRFPMGHGGRGGTTCVYREVATSDADGRYVIPSTTGKFDVHRQISLENDTRYFWKLDARAPDYLFAWPQNMYQTGGDHPAAHGHGETETLDPVQLTSSSSGGERISLDTYDCPQADSNAPPFLAQVYQEAFALACGGGAVEPRHVADFRQELRGAMPPLAPALVAQLDGIRQHYRFNDPPSKEEDSRICDILRQSNEEQQP